MATAPEPQSVERSIVWPGAPRTQGLLEMSRRRRSSDARSMVAPFAPGRSCSAPRNRTPASVSGPTARTCSSSAFAGLQQNSDSVEITTKSGLSELSTKGFYARSASSKSFK